ncbi:MAG: BamA/TamA family outer membrane protein [Deltaproteobacteria bacterium]|nr:BamA/TamA family outer membrane protein [Deltaproteobacteria bacterium]
MPSNRYGVQRLRLEGVEAMDPAALRACLATRERPAFGINLGSSSVPSCGVPPFDSGRLHLRLWRWPWTTWPTYDRAVFERDLQRIERWYRARGYYDARVVSAEFDPPVASNNDRTTGADGQPVCERGADDEGCRLRLSVSVEEGRPVTLARLRVVGDQSLAPRLRRRLRDAIELEEGARFDEALHDRSKRGILTTLHEDGFACASVHGRVTVTPRAHSAQVLYTLDAGPRARIGSIRVEGNEELPERAIRGAAYLRSGDRYHESALQDAQRAIFALGGLSSVEVVGRARRRQGAEDSDDPSACTGLVDVTIRVAPGRRTRIGLGAGIQSGVLEAQATQGETLNVAQWDLHLLAFYEHRNLLGGMRRLRIEDRPKLVFPAQFPGVRAADGDRGPRPGNTLSFEFRQPAFLEARTTLSFTTSWDLGPDPSFGFFRHDFDGRVGVRRRFLRDRLEVYGGVHGNVFRVPGGSDLASGGLRGNRSDYYLSFLEQFVALDLRDNPGRPRRGIYLSLGLQEAGFFMPSAWDYIRVLPEARGYIPLPLGMVLAGRFSVGALFIRHADAGLDAKSFALGPVRYRLRGGGPTSHRGFVAGFLGDSGAPAGPGESFDSEDGGLRRWLASVELRAPVTQDFGLVLFSDLGDVTQSKRFRFRHLNTAVGLGIRYQTPVGPLRFDVGWLVPGAGAVGGARPAQGKLVSLGFVRFPGAVHLTIGEAF